jgi:hypothetical protein
MAALTGPDISAVALASGALGALGTAILNYCVQLLIRKREERRRKQHVARVHFIRLTEIVATDQIVNFLLQTLPNVKVSESEDFKVSHLAAAILAKAIQDAELKSPERIVPLFEGASESLAASFSKFELSTDELRELDDDSVWFYYQFEFASVRVRQSFEVILRLWKSDPKSIHSTSFHDVISAYRQLIEASGLLRAKFGTIARLSDSYSQNSLLRSVEALRKKVAEQLEDKSKLGKAMQYINDLTAKAVS